MPAIGYKGILRCSLLLLLMATPRLACSQAQPSAPLREVEVCQILSDPNAFDGRMVRLRGRLDFEFEDHSVNDLACGQPLLHTGIWWVYGGDSYLAREPELKNVQSLTSPVLKDAQFEEFDVRTRAYRRSKPDGGTCRSHHECAYYDVVATYTGRFVAGKIRPGRTLAGGFGHMGCCHLFVIEQISDVEARRTSLPDDDQQFSCTTTTWQSEFQVRTVPNLDARLAANKQFLIGQARAHGDDSLIETMESDSPWHFLGLTGFLAWSSSDLLTTYTAQFPQLPHPKKAKQHAPVAPATPIVMNVSRERCEPAVN
jgi:hypothetical protein